MAIKLTDNENSKKQQRRINRALIFRLQFCYGILASPAEGKAVEFVNGTTWLVFFQEMRQMF
jgi:hypothetical protein